MLRLKILRGTKNVTMFILDDLKLYIHKKLIIFLNNLK